LVPDFLLGESIMLMAVGMEISRHGYDPRIKTVIWIF